jgi:hypothetical protein
MSVFITPTIRYLSSVTFDSSRKVALVLSCPLQRNVRTRKSNPTPPLPRFSSGSLFRWGNANQELNRQPGTIFGRRAEWFLLREADLLEQILKFGGGAKTIETPIDF